MILGITGGIGSGKSLVASILERSGTPVYLADDRAKSLMITDPSIISGVTDLFGEEAYFEDGQLNRAHLSKLAFGNPEILKKLNAVVHPATGKDFVQWVDQKKQEGYLLVAKEAAILFESAAYLACDKVATVYAPQNIRVQRVVARDNTTAKEVHKRIKRQWPEWKKIRKSDFLIINDGRHHLIPQVLDMQKELLRDIELPEKR